MDRKNNIGIGLAVGSAIATAAAVYFLYGTKGAKKRRDKIRGWVLRAKGEIIEKLENLTEVNKEKYHAIVKEILTRYGKMKNVGDAEIVSLEKELKAYWEHLRKEVKADGKKTAKKVRKSVSKIVKSAK